MYEIGKRLIKLKQFEEGIFWFNEGINRGHFLSVVEMGELYLNGNGVELNKELSTEYFKLAKEWNSNSSIPLSEVDNNNTESIKQNMPIDEDTLFEDAYRQSNNKFIETITPITLEKSYNFDNFKTKDNEEFSSPKISYNEFDSTNSQVAEPKLNSSGLYNRITTSNSTDNKKEEKEEEEDEPSFIWNAAEFAISYGLPLVVGLFLYKRMTEVN